jgi:RNA polymerase sigma-70 factor (ECF subfamily)
VARRFEAGRPAAAVLDWDQVADDGPSLSQVFDRAWAAALVREAGQRQAEIARTRGPEAERRVELLRLRFHDGLPIREIARLWQADPARLHHEYATARREYREALREVVAFHQPGAAADVERACAELLALLAEK